MSTVTHFPALVIGCQFPTGYGLSHWQRNELLGDGSHPYLIQFSANLLNTAIKKQK